MICKKCKTIIGDRQTYLKEIESKLTAERERSAKVLAALKEGVESFDTDSVQGSGDYYRGICCGLEDMGITDRYDAMSHGYSKAIERVNDEIIEGLKEAIEEYEGAGKLEHQKLLMI